MNRWILGLASLAVGSSCALGVASAILPSAADDAESTKEFGAVSWGRKLEPALATAKDSKKPIMLLFQEVPG